MRSDTPDIRGLVVCLPPKVFVSDGRKCGLNNEFSFAFNFTIWLWKSWYLLNLGNGYVGDWVGYVLFSLSFPPVLGTEPRAFHILGKLSTMSAPILAV